MVELFQKLWMTLTYFSQNIEKYLIAVLQKLDPSLFQNIILGVLAIFIPFAIVFLTDVLNYKNEKRSEFEKMVLSDEVLGTKKIFWLSIVGLIFFAFFSGTDISESAKIVSLIVLLILIIQFWKPFKNILRFSEGYKPEFEISFLKKLTFSKFSRIKNQSKSEKILRAWSSFWSEKSEYNERDITNIFISHIDDSINFGKFDLAVQLAQTYVNNIEKRDRFSIGDKILPKVFGWNEIFWNEEQNWLKTYDKEKRNKNFFFQKYFLKIGHWILRIYKKLNSKRERNWKKHYFRSELLQIIIKTLLKDAVDRYQLFSSFKNHIDESVTKLNKIIDEKEKEKYWSFISGLFANFCPTFFNEIYSLQSSQEILENDFPEEWKVTIANKDNRISRIILYEFLQWSRARILKEENEKNLDKDLSNIISGIFPNAHPSLFTAFLMLLVSNDVKYALTKKPNFYIYSTNISWIDYNVNEKDSDKELSTKLKTNEISQIEDTIQIILNYFARYWNVLQITLDAENKDEWNIANNEKRTLLLKSARRVKLGNIKMEIESNEIKEICKDSELKELFRKEFLTLIELLILEMDK